MVHAFTGDEPIDGEISRPFQQAKLIHFVQGVSAASQQYFDVLVKLFQWSKLQMSGLDLRPESIPVRQFVQ
ncbi:MAG: hypothetical protein OSB69_14500 [Alphaproteobacteria bacterium]|nr:hypothetical protein [Alphaproteobacteria bacterium]